MDSCGSIQDGERSGGSPPNRRSINTSSASSETCSGWIDAESSRLVSLTWEPYIFESKLAEIERRPVSLLPSFTKSGMAYACQGICWEAVVHSSKLHKLTALYLHDYPGLDEIIIEKGALVKNSRNYSLAGVLIWRSCLKVMNTLPSSKKCIWMLLLQRNLQRAYKVKEVFDHPKVWHIPIINHY